MYGNAPAIVILLIVFAFLVFLAMGLLLFFTGRRGVAVDDHPLCRRCGFDLVCQPTESDRCPECGAEMRNPGAIVIGHRRRRTGLMAAGGILVLASMVVFGRGAYSVGQQVDWGGLMPAWWLLHEANSSVKATRESAMAQLVKRDKSSTLDADDRVKLIELSLSLQANSAIPFDRTCGDFLSDCVKRDLLSPEQCDQFIRNMLLPVAMTLRKDICSGDSLQIVLSIGGPRMPGQTSLAAFHLNRDEQFFVDGKPLSPVQYSGNGGGGSTLSFTHRIQTIIGQGPLSGIGVGEHEVEVRTMVEVRDSFEKEARVVARIPISAKGKFTIHPSDAKLIKLVSDPSLGPIFSRAISGQVIINNTGANIRFAFSNPTPMGFGFDVIIRQSGREWFASRISATSQSPGSTWDIGTRFEGIVPGQADLILRANPDAARSTIDVYEIWDGEIVLKDVPVR